GDPRLDDPAYETIAGRKAAEADIDAVIAEWARQQDPDEAAERLQAAGVAAAPVLTPLMIAEDPQLRARGFFLEYDHPDVGVCRTAAPAWRLRRRPVTSVRPAPQFGQHTVEVLTSVAGYSESEVARLAEAGV